MENSIKVKDQRLYSLIVLYDMHTDYYLKAIDGISDDAAQNRLDTKANHVAWLAGSMLQERFEIAGLLGEKMQQTHHELFREHQGIKDGVKYPALADFKSDWQKVSPILREQLVNLSTEKLDSIFEMEGMKMTHFELLSFDIYREANIIGQLVLWRRLLGYPGIKYD